MDAELILERRRLRRRASFWRTAALVCAALAVIAFGLKLSGAFQGKAAPHVARVELSGIILDSDERSAMFKEIGESSARAVLLEISSPGGGVTASEELYTNIRALAEKKPVVAVLGSVAASGGYVAALAADRIIARQTSLTGSIGVLMQYPDLSKLLGTLGVTVQEVKSAPLKAVPNMFSPTSEDARAALESLVMDSFAWFKGLVSARRGLTGDRLERVVDGRAFTGNQAIELGLVDEIGGDEQARAWLAAQRQVSEDLPVRDWEPEDHEGFPGFGHSALATLAELAGFSGLAAGLRESGALDLQALDGLVAIWHPQLHN